MAAIYGTRRRFVGAGMGAVAWGLAAGPSGAAQYEFKCGTQLPADDLACVRLGQMWSAVQRESGGRIAIQFYPGSSLGSEDSMLSQLRLGALHFQYLTPGTLAAIVPSANVAFLGFAYKDAAEGLRVFDGPVGDYVRQETLAKGIYAFRTHWNTGMGQVGVNPRPIWTPDDFPGLKIRVSGNKISLDLFKALGANATALSFAEVYTGLQTKLVDGTQSSLAIIESARWYEVLKYASMTNHAWFSQMLISNGATWRSLPADLQTVIERNNTKYAMLERKDAMAFDAAMQTKLVSQGLTLNTVDQTPFRQRLRSYFQEWASEFGPTEWTLLQNALGRKLV